MSKCLVLFVEGDTEVEFYKQVVANARKLHPAGRFDTNIEYRNVRGVGGFKSIALRKFTKEIKPKYGDDCEFTIVSDLFYVVIRMYLILHQNHR